MLHYSRLSILGFRDQHFNGMAIISYEQALLAAQAAVRKPDMFLLPDKKHHPQATMDSELACIYIPMPPHKVEPRTHLNPCRPRGKRTLV